MPVNWQSLFADRTEKMRSSDIREILKVTARPDVISLAGGLPAPELFPIEEYRKAFEWVLETEGQVALQYGLSEGYTPLRDLVAERMAHVGVRTTGASVLITNGSQQTLDLAGKIFLNPDDVVVLENPSYLGAIQAFNQYQPKYTAVPMDEHGMRVDMLEQILETDRRGPRRIKLIYAIPNFQNPTGRTMSGDRRERLVELATRYGVVIVEDDPYGELRYEGEHLPSLKSFDAEGVVIYMGTFSKILAPGFRLGWAVAAPDIFEQLLHGKQPADLHTSTATQMATFQVAKGGFVDKHVERLIGFYRQRRDIMLEAMAEHFPLEAKFNRPEGGLFVWVELPEYIDTRELLAEAIENKVAFVPGQAFHADGSGKNTMRLNFSNVPPDKLREGVRRLGLAIKQRLAQGASSGSPAVV